MLEVGAARKPKHPFDDRAKDRLGENLLVGAVPGGAYVSRKVLDATELLEDRRIVLDRRFQLPELVGCRDVQGRPTFVTVSFRTRGR